MSRSKYDELATTLCRELHAGAIVVLVVNGPYGHGACRAEALMPRMPRDDLRATIAVTLRNMADRVELDDVQPHLDPPQAEN